MLISACGLMSLLEVSEPGDSSDAVDELGCCVVLSADFSSGVSMSEMLF